MYHACFYTKDFCWTANFIRNMYKIHITTESPERVEYFKKCTLYTEYLFKGMTILYILSSFSFFIYPLYMYFFENEIVPILPIYLPGIDENTRNGFIILTTFQGSAFFMVLFGLLGFIIVIFVSSPLIFAKIIWFEVQQIHCDLKEDEPPIVIKYRFRNILLLHQQTAV